MTKKINILFAGCGFLASHLVLHAVPHVNSIVLVDREKVEKVNYDNYVLPKNYTGRQKIIAFASLIQLTSPVRVVPIHTNIKNAKQLADICSENEINFVVVTFDNIQARLIAKECAMEQNIPSLFIGVTENFAYIDWDRYVMLPTTDAEIERVEAELKRVRDVCSRLEFRGLGLLASGYAYHSFVKWLTNGEKWMHQIYAGDGVRSTSLKRS